MNQEGSGRLGDWKAVLLGNDGTAQLQLTLRCGFSLLMGFTLAWARLLQRGSPFALSWVACSGSGLGGVCALIGASLGYLISGGIDWGIRYVAASVLVFTVAFVFQELKFAHSPFFMPAAAALVMGLTGFLTGYAVYAETAPLVLELALEVSLAFISTYFFRCAVTPRTRSTAFDEQRRSIAVTLLLGAVLMALSRVTLFATVSLGRVAALWLLMASACKGGMLSGAAVGTILGMGMDLAAPDAYLVYFTMLYAFSGLVSGFFGKFGRLFFTLSFVLSQALAVVCAWNRALYLSALVESFAASVSFLLLPGSWVNTLAMLRPNGEPGSGETGLRRFSASRLEALSEAYRALYETVQDNLDAPTNDENLAKVFDRAADRVCVSCSWRNRCWNSEYMDTLSAMNDASQAMVKNGRLTQEDLPGFFRRQCSNLPSFVDAVNDELRRLSYRRQLKNRLNENRSLAWGQYRDMAELLGQLAKELGSLSGADALAEQRLDRYLRSLDIDAEVAVYRDGGGRLHLTIESGRLTPLLDEPDYLEKLSEIVGVRLCQPIEPQEGCAKLSLLEAEPLAVSVGIAAMKKRGERTSGDKGSYFKTDDGILCVILSDGMGTGDEAARDSAQVVTLLERFLRSGLDPAVAMKLLNSVMLLRGGDNWGCATADLMCVNLFTGETCFYKYGAAPSFVRSGQHIRRIQGETLAVGLNTGDGVSPDVVRMRLKPGCTAVIASDGVVSDSEDGWLRELLLRSDGDMKSLARSTLKEAEAQYGASDDMTVVTVRVEQRA